MASAQPANSSTRQPCILLAEDDLDDFYFFQLAMEKYAAEIKLVHALDGREAMAYLEDTASPAPDLIVTDLKMPRINGFELLEWLKQHPDLSKLPAVVFSSSDEVTDRNRAKELGAKNYHVKAGNHRDFVEEVTRICKDLLSQGRV